MAQARSPIEQVLRQIERMSEEQQCELLEAMLLKQRRSDLGGHDQAIRSRCRDGASSSQTRRGHCNPAGTA